MRMERDKATLEWEGVTFVEHLVAVVGAGVGGPVVVVRAPGQALPPLPHGVEVADDPREGLGPVQGLAAGLAAVGSRAPVAYLAATDMPLLRAEFVRRVLSAVGDEADVALPVIDGHHQPVAAAYRTALAPLVAELVAAGRLRPADLYARCRVRRLDEAWLLGDDALSAADPELRSLTSVDTPEAYAAARDMFSR
jgi:molybdopterin-guanine dinucleotide biosynthesis protein A